MRTMLVCGSRDWTDEATITRVLAKWWVDHEVTILHGNCRGADRIAADVARTFGWEVRPFPADWKAHGKAAGFIRNRQMLDQCPDLVIAFQLDGSRGTQDTIDEARRRGIPVKVVAA